MGNDYLRDKRSPIPLNENVSKVMRSNRSKNTKPELVVRKFNMFSKKGNAKSSTTIKIEHIKTIEINNNNFCLLFFTIISYFLKRLYSIKF